MKRVLSIQKSNQLSSTEQNLLLKIKWLSIIRIIVATIILGSITILQIKQTQASLFPFYTLIAIIYLLTVLYGFIIRFNPNPVFFAYTQIIGDIIIETALIFYTGGIRSPFSFTYIITIITASIILSRKSSIIVATLNSLTYISLLSLQFTGLLKFPQIYVSEGIQLNLPYVSYTLFANIFAFYLIAFLCGHLAELQRKVDKELKTKDGNIAQLQTFNENILQSMSSGLIVTDLSGKIRLMNRSAVRILAPSPLKQNNGQRFWNQIFHPLKIEKLFLQMKKQKKNSLRLDTLITKDKQKIPLGITISFLKTPRGEAEGLITNFQDLTDLKKMEEQVKQAEMLATIGQMSASMAHELRNPMASIKGSVQFLNDELHLDQNHQRLMEIILKESDRLNMIITDFLDYAKPKPPTKEKCPIPDLVQETIILIQNNQEFRKDIKIITDVPPSLPPIEADPGQIKQVFWNLAINACQAMPGGGILQLRIRQDGDNFLLIEFADTGLGIAVDKIKKLFHPFYTTKEKGMGLGLSIAYRIIEEHMGKIEVISAPGEGSNFKVFLPCKSKALLGAAA